MHSRKMFYGSFKISWYLYFRYNGNTLNAHTEEALTSTPNIESSQAMSIFSWFKEYQLYQIAVIYMSSRFFNNIRSNFFTKFTDSLVSDLNPAEAIIIPEQNSKSYLWENREENSTTLWQNFKVVDFPSHLWIKTSR